MAGDLSVKPSQNHAPRNKGLSHEVEEEPNDMLLQKIIRHFDNIQVAMDRVGGVLAVQYGINLNGMGQEEKRGRKERRKKATSRPQHTPKASCKEGLITSSGLTWLARRRPSTLPARDWSTLSTLRPPQPLRPSRAAPLRPRGIERSSSNDVPYAVRTRPEAISKV